MLAIIVVVIVLLASSVGDLGSELDPTTVADLATKMAMAQGGGGSFNFMAPAAGLVDAGAPLDTATALAATPDGSTQASFSRESGTMTLGDAAGWVIFQEWDGVNADSIVYGVIEPGYVVSIPAPCVGTAWTAPNTSKDVIAEQAVMMRDQAVIQNNLGSIPPLVYVGSGEAPQDFSADLPSGWRESQG